jgi:hypothetical protein
VDVPRKITLLRFVLGGEAVSLGINAVSDFDDLQSRKQIMKFSSAHSTHRRGRDDDMRKLPWNNARPVSTGC